MKEGETMKNSLKISILALTLALSFILGSCGIGIGPVVKDDEEGTKTDGFTFFDTAYGDIGANDVSMESSTDSFTLSEITYGAEDRFVFTSTVSFENGVAAGLVFGAEDGSHYWVFNVDREANLVKFLL